MPSNNRNPQTQDTRTTGDSGKKAAAGRHSPARATFTTPPVQDSQAERSVMQPEADHPEWRYCRSSWMG